LIGTFWQGKCPSQNIEGRAVHSNAGLPLPLKRKMNLAKKVHIAENSE
jgi:hypothetical protein